MQSNSTRIFLKKALLASSGSPFNISIQLTFSHLYLLGTSKSERVSPTPHDYCYFCKSHDIYGRKIDDLKKMQPNVKDATKRSRENDASLVQQLSE